MKASAALLDQKVLFDQYLGRCSISLSTYHFSSIFLWQDFFNFTFEEINGALCVFAQQANSSFLYLPPLGTMDIPVIEKCFEKMDAVNPRTARIENLTESQIQQLPPQFKAYQKAQEYVYRKDDLIHLEGQAYKSQRHDINLATRDHDLDYRPYEDADFAACQKLYELWAKERFQKHEDAVYRTMLEENKRVHPLALQFHHQLGLVARVVATGGKIVAYSLGYPLNSDTFCVLLEVSDLRIKGLSAFIFNRFCRDAVWQSYSFVNTMDDFGMPQVAQAKEAYHPIQHLPVYTVSRRLSS